MTSRKQRQWVWFVALWCAGLGAALVLAYGLRLLMRIGPP
jgi:hypothetical protein